MQPVADTVGKLSDNLRDKQARRVRAVETVDPTSVVRTVNTRTLPAPSEEAFSYEAARTRETSLTPMIYVSVFGPSLKAYELHTCTRYMARF